MTEKHDPWQAPHLAAQDRIDELERERDEWKDRYELAIEMGLAAERERDEAREQTKDQEEWTEYWHKRYDDCWFEAERLREALWEVDGLLRVCDEAPTKKGAQIRKARRILEPETRTG